MFDFEFTGFSYGDQIDRYAATAAAEGKAKELLGEEWKAKMDAISATFQSDDGPSETDQTVWSEIEYAASLAAFAGWSEMPDNMSLVWR